MSVFFQIQLLFWSAYSLQFPKIGDLSKVKFNTLYLGYIFGLNCMMWNWGEWSLFHSNLCTIKYITDQLFVNVLFLC